MPRPERSSINYRNTPRDIPRGRGLVAISAVLGLFAGLPACTYAGSTTARQDSSAVFVIDQSKRLPVMDRFGNMEGMREVWSDHQVLLSGDQEHHVTLRITKSENLDGGDDAKDVFVFMLGNASDMSDLFASRPMDSVSLYIYRTGQPNFEKIIGLESKRVRDEFTGKEKTAWMGSGKIEPGSYVISISMSIDDVDYLVNTRRAVIRED